jgi:hypothetical protein
MGATEEQQVNFWHQDQGGWVLSIVSCTDPVVPRLRYRDKNTGDCSEYRLNAIVDSILSCRATLILTIHWVCTAIEVISEILGSILGS